MQVEPLALKRATMAAALMVKSDLEAAATSGDTDRRDRRLKLLDALELIAGDGEALHLIAQGLRS